MKVGFQSGDTSKENLEFKAPHGVFNLDGDSPKYIKDVGWNLQDSLGKKGICEKNGISIDAYHLPLDSEEIEKVAFPNIMLGKSHERDRKSNTEAVTYIWTIRTLYSLTVFLLILILPIENKGLHLPQRMHQVTSASNVGRIMLIARSLIQLLNKNNLILLIFLLWISKYDILN